MRCGNVGFLLYHFLFDSGSQNKKFMAWSRSGKKASSHQNFYEIRRFCTIRMYICVKSIVFRITKFES